VTTLPVAAILLATTALEDSVQPSAPPKDNVRISWPSETPSSNASTITIELKLAQGYAYDSE
jgi:hypothetical protein